MQREQKITLGEMRSSGGPTRLLVFGDYSARSLSSSAPKAGMMTSASPTWSRSSHVGLCGHRGANIRPLFAHTLRGTG